VVFDSTSEVGTLAANLSNQPALIVVTLLSINVLADKFVELPYI